MSSERVVLIDASFVGHLGQLGSGACGLLEFILESHGESVEGDDAEIAQIDYCIDAIRAANIGHHGIEDQDALQWYSSLPSDQAESLRKLFDDGADLKLLMRSINLSGKEMLVTCDRGLLIAAVRYDLQHRCFKAAVVYADTWIDGGLRNASEFGTDVMEFGGPHPFLHFGNDKHCAQCDPKGNCAARNP